MNPSLPPPTPLSERRPVACDLRVLSLEERESLMDRLEFVRNQLNVLTEDVKEKIKATADEVAAKVGVLLQLQTVRRPPHTRHNNKPLGVYWAH